MEELKQRILADGKARAEGGVVMVGSFLNHQMDPQLMMRCAQEFARLFKDQGITKIVTIEASGIAPAIMTNALPAPAKQHSAKPKHAAPNMSAAPRM